MSVMSTSRNCSAGFMHFASRHNYTHTIGGQHKYWTCWIQNNANCMLPDCLCFNPQLLTKKHVKSSLATIRVRTHQCAQLSSGWRSSDNHQSWWTRYSMAVHCRTLACSFTLPTFQVAEDFALPAETALSSLRFTAPLLAAKHFRLLALGCATACHRRLRWRRLWRPSALNSRRFSSQNHILTFGSSNILYIHTVDLSVF